MKLKVFRFKKVKSTNNTAIRILKKTNHNFGMIILFSLAGIPPLAGFFAKFYVFKSVIEQSMYFLAIVGLLSTVVAAFYYLRLIKIMYFDKEKEKYDTDHGWWLKFSLTFSTLLILVYFIFPSQLIEVVSRINII